MKEKLLNWLCYVRCRRISTQEAQIFYRSFEMPIVGIQFVNETTYQVRVRVICRNIRYLQSHNTRNFQQPDKQQQLSNQSLATGCAMQTPRQLNPSYVGQIPAISANSSHGMQDLANVAAESGSGC